MKYIAVILSGMTFFCNMAFASQFETSEHIFAGDQVTLSGVSDPALGLSNGLKLTYGEIMSMPDFYGDPNHAISNEPTLLTQEQTFTTLFNAFDHSDIAYFNAFWPLILNECKIVSDALKNHQDVASALSKIIPGEFMALTVVTQGKMMDLAIHGFDHFGEDAINAYIAGHEVATQTAIAGYQIRMHQNTAVNLKCAHQPNYQQCFEDKAHEKLIKAYEENAYACHFLSDRYAGGHIRTPFRALSTVRPNHLLGGAVGGVMHGEDGRNGVMVSNSSQKEWIAYGDQYYFYKDNQTNRHELKRALQLSADEIYGAYKNGKNDDTLSHNLLNIIPYPLPANSSLKVNGQLIKQTAALYQFHEGKVLQRMDINNLYNDQWAMDWNELLTLLTYKSPNRKE